MSADTSTDQPKKQGFLSPAVWRWAMWDWGSAAFNSVVTTFVFAAYLTNKDLFGPDANSYLGWVLAAAGIVVAIIAPALGQWTDRTGRRNSTLTWATLGVVVIMAFLFFVKPDGGGTYMWLGLILVALGNIIFETGSVVYNSTVSDISTKETVGRVSGFGWGMGYVGGIVLLAILYVGFIAPDVGWFGVTSEDGTNIRVSMVISAAWFLLSALPLMIKGKDREPSGSQTHGIIEAYRQVFRSIAQFWRTDRSVVWFLISSAIYRDGLAGVFSFGGVLAAAAFGFEADEVLIFGIAANVVAGIATIVFGRLDDRSGSRAVILLSLTTMVVVAFIIFFAHAGIDLGPIQLTPTAMFWIFGLILCVFVGPTQSASRTYLARIAPHGEEGELFGLYATTGRAVSFLAPFMYSTCITIAANVMGTSRADAAYFGILGIVLVLLVGLLAFIPVKPQRAP
ncbi:MFS transporter [Ancrocorticia populi]|uniref:MFS transporter n=1 Tax=Ancrocorticia populi TaxID=2175228 RepID=A0A2V1KBM5_9ACTO|nr:MFS transporter [Ancrocorticia populi]PWF27131.1 MFS transporter [Ancrocorticia populi]